LLSLTQPLLFFQLCVKQVYLMQLVSLHLAQVQAQPLQVLRVQQAYLMQLVSLHLAQVQAQPLQMLRLWSVLPLSLPLQLVLLLQVV
jgi:hypothetical protein